MFLFCCSTNEVQLLQSGLCAVPYRPCSVSAPSVLISVCLAGRSVPPPSNRVLCPGMALGSQPDAWLIPPGPKSRWKVLSVQVWPSVRRTFPLQDLSYILTSNLLRQITKCSRSRLLIRTYFGGSKDQAGLSVTWQYHAFCRKQGCGNDAKGESVRLLISVRRPQTYRRCHKSNWNHQQVSLTQLAPQRYLSLSSAASCCFYLMVWHACLLSCRGRSLHLLCCGARLIIKWRKQWDWVEIFSKPWSEGRCLAVCRCKTA